MKRYLILALAVFALLAVAPSALAVRIRVVDADPVVCAEGHSCDITNLASTYAFTFMPVVNPLCQSAAATPGPGADISDFTWCIIFNNFSSQPMTALNFTFVVPGQGVGDDYNTVTCDGFPDTVENNSCPMPPLQVGQTVAALFSAADPGIPNGMSAYLFVDFENQPGDVNVGFPNTNATAVPEPGMLGLFGLGLVVIGVGFGWQKRRTGLVRQSDDSECNA